MKKTTNSQLSRIINERKGSICEMERKRREYEAQRDSYKNSPEGQFEQKVRLATQTATKAEMAAYESFVKATVDLKEETIDYMLQENWRSDEYDDGYKAKALQMMILEGNNKNDL